MAEHSVCPTTLAGSLDNIFRRWIHNPKKLLGKHVKQGMTVLDIGCGSGLFSRAMAGMVGPRGRVIAADIQQGMLDMLKKRSKGIRNIVLHKSEPDRIGVKEEVDFVLAFYMVHEVWYKDKFFKELRSIMKKDAVLLLIEPKWHVSAEEFEDTVKLAKEAGFKEQERPRVLLSRAIVFKKFK